MKSLVASMWFMAVSLVITSIVLQDLRVLLVGWAVTSVIGWLIATMILSFEDEVEEDEDEEEERPPFWPPPASSTSGGSASG